VDDQIPEFRQRINGMDGMEMVAELFGQEANNSGVLLQQGKVERLHTTPTIASCSDGLGCGGSADNFKIASRDRAGVLL
jgi:hypothetical protein